jgi:subtilisin family serine protease
MEVKMKNAGRLLVITLLIAYVFYTPCQASSSNKDLAKFEELQLKALGSGKVRVIIKLDVPSINELMSGSKKFPTVEPGRASLWGGADADRALADAISYSAEFVKFALGKAHFKVHHIYKSIPYMALEVSAEALSALEFMPEVLAIEEDVPEPLPDPVEPATPADLDKPMLNNTVNIIGASNAWSMGYTGAGWYIAVLDTGIRKTHEMFAGKTIVEACYSLGWDGEGPAGDCPNGLTTMTGPGAAVHFASSYKGYDHGTHVSGSRHIRSGKRRQYHRSTGFFQRPVFREHRRLEF